jgi:putative membrane protein
MTNLLHRMTRRPGSRFSPLTVLGLVLVPLIVAGLLVWGLWSPEDRLNTVTAAIVNNDQPVSVGDQYVPLGRQLAAGLVDGADTGATNFTWVITDASGAAQGLTSGEYVAVVTIPKNFSAAATSPAGDASSAEQATIDVATSDKSLLVDNAISTAITSTAATLLGRQLTTNYLENVYVGFNTLSDQLAKAADGANALATGTLSLADGLSQLSSGASQLSGGLSTLARQTADLPSQTQQLADGASQTNAGAQQVATGASQVSGGLAALSAQCATAADWDPSSPFCATLAQYAGAAAGVATGAAGVATGTDALSSGASGLASGLPALTGGISSLATASAQLSQGLSGTVTGTTDLGTGMKELAAGLETAVAELPTYTQAQRTQLADVVADPVGVAGGTSLTFGQSSTPLYVVLALWIGALATFIALGALPRRLLESTRSSTVLTLRSFAVPALIGVVQGVLVAAIIAIAQGYSFGEWLSIAGISAIIGVVFAATNQALIALLGGAGRLVSMSIALLILVTGVIATVPTALVTALGFTPATVAVTSLQAVLAGGSLGGVGGAVAALIFWMLGALAVTILLVARKRRVSVRQLLRAAKPA